jgi:hypothetical protein
MNTKQARDPKIGKYVRKSSPIIHEDDNRRFMNADDVKFEYEEEAENTGIALAIVFGFVFAFIIVVALIIYYNI